VSALVRQWYRPPGRVPQEYGSGITRCQDRAWACMSLWACCRLRVGTPCQESRTGLLQHLMCQLGHVVAAEQSYQRRVIALAHGADCVQVMAWPSGSPARSARHPDGQSPRWQAYGGGRSGSSCWLDVLIGGDVAGATARSFTGSDWAEIWVWERCCGGCPKTVDRDVRRYEYVGDGGAVPAYEPLCMLR